jgi:hypothetical protein
MAFYKLQLWDAQQVPDSDDLDSCGTQSQKREQHCTQLSHVYTDRFKHVWHWAHEASTICAISCVLNTHCETQCTVEHALHIAANMTSKVSRKDTTAQRLLGMPCSAPWPGHAVGGRLASRCGTGRTTARCPRPHTYKHDSAHSVTRRHVVRGGHSSQQLPALPAQTAADKHHPNEKLNSRLAVLVVH